jgi:LysM repeat protein
MADIKCPVCGKAGIPDYLNEDVKCPCCGSDLSIYRVIDSIPEEGQKTNIWKPISAVAIIAAAVLGILLLTQKPDVPATPLAEITQLKDSIEVLNNQLAQTNNATTQISSGFKYVVSKGESYWSISRKFYGIGTHANEIAQENDRTLDSPLMVGDTLIIK